MSTPGATTSPSDASTDIVLDLAALERPYLERFMFDDGSTVTVQSYNMTGWARYTAIDWYAREHNMKPGDVHIAGSALLTGNRDRPKLDEQLTLEPAQTVAETVAL